MRVGIDLRLYAYRQAGIANYALRLARELSRIMIDETLLVYQHRKYRERLVDCQTRWLRTPCHHRFEQAALAVELFGAPIELLHSPDFIPPFHRTFRSVATVHDLSYYFYPEFLTTESRRYYNQVERALSSADAILTDAESTRQDLNRVYGFPLERVEAVLLAADEQFRPLDQNAVFDFCRQRGLPERPILWVGTLEPRKNVTTLLRAFARLDTAASLVLAGQPGWLYQDTLGQIEALGLTSRVTLYRPTSAADLPFLYNAARLLVYPSYYEGFGFPVLEAMACGTPVVCSNAGSLPEVAGDAALMVAPTDEDGLASAMARVLDDQALAQRMVSQGFTQTAKFSWEKTARQTLDVYRKVLA